jgi:cation transport ATPase
LRDKSPGGQALESGTHFFMDAGIILTLITLGKLTAIRQNLFWAFAYNIVGIPLAALGLFGRYGPLIAALAMSLSSVTVVARSSLLAGLDLEK